MKKYKSKSGERVIEAVQYEGTYGQNKGILFFLRNKGYSVSSEIAGIVIHGITGSRTLLAPSYWLVVRPNELVQGKTRIQIMKDKDFRRAYEVTHG